MATMEMIIARLEALAEDITFEVTDTDIEVTIEDFAGFDEEWEEVERELVDAEAVEAFEEWLEAEAESIEGDMYRYYHFAGCTVCVGYASFDI